MLTPDVQNIIRHASLRQLEIFETVARLGSFTRAAESLFLTQPTVSTQVRKLSDTLGFPLIEHIGKRFYLTEAGQKVQECCEEIFESLRGLGMNLSDMAGLKSGRMRLSVVTTAEYFAPRVLGEFCEMYPGIDIELRVVNRGRLLQRFAGNLDDLHILGTPPEGFEGEATPFVENPQVALAAAGHPLAGEKDVSLARLAEEPMIMREAGSGTRKAVERLFHEAGLEPKIRMELGSNEAIKQAVAGGLGVSILSKHTVSFMGGSPQLAVLDVKGLPLKRSWHLIHHKGKRLSPVALAFKDYLLERGPSLFDPAAGQDDVQDS